MPGVEGLLEGFENLLLGWEDLVLQKPLAIDVRGADEKVKVSPSTKKWEEEVAGWDATCCCKRSQVHAGSSPSAHGEANSLWLQRLSMTEGFLVKDHGSGRLL